MASRKAVEAMSIFISNALAKEVPEGMIDAWMVLLEHQHDEDLGPAVVEVLREREAKSGFFPDPGLIVEACRPYEIKRIRAEFRRLEGEERKNRLKGGLT